ncbi:B-cell antigen receptor complex-associated protein alpha chain [Platysternon megacephalum]|uniref:Alkylglycerone-phosphate synthase n=1 Tax=Platysternon megacephalum TaxID=55544 RepID=A0A4D9DK19_9SAUR|nr:B-cell antigen receptor complex-associated protein alpha chain [Platysternon megacephalum]
MEAQLAKEGWTMGHFPDSFTHSSLGGWIATRSSGMQSDKYGDIADITRGLQMVMPGQVLDLKPTPSASTGPSVREMVLGSEGRLGVITEAWVNVHRIPQERHIYAYFFPNYHAGLDAMREIHESDAAPSVARVSDENETRFSLSTSKKSKGLSKLVAKGFQKVLEMKGWDLDSLCLSFIGFEGSKSHVSYTKKLVDGIVKAHGGVSVGKGPGVLYDQKKFDTPYIRDFLLDFGAMADVSETATPWDMTKEIHDSTVQLVQDAFDEIGVTGYIMCHLSHSYHSGACQYFTFALNDPSENGEASYDKVKKVIQDNFMKCQASISHHHGVGEEHAPWLAQDISPAGVFMQKALFDGVDPGQNLNPGKIIHDGEPGISSNAAK